LPQRERSADVGIDAAALKRPDWIEGLGRAGLVAKGIVYGVIGLLAVDLALGDGVEQSPDRDGALRAIAAQPFGRVLLTVLAAGFAGYALWRLAQALFDREDEGSGAKALAKRGGYLVRAGWYGALCILTASKIAGAGAGGGGNEDEATAGLLGYPLGRELVAAAGIGFLAAAAFNGYRGITCKFEQKLETRKMSDAEEKLMRVTGVLGHLARLVVFGLVGAFLLKAAWEFDPNEAVGLDGALQTLQQQPYGSVLLGVVAAGLLAYALFCLVQARYRDV
jgi:hypothetical protein